MTDTPATTPTPLTKKQLELLKKPGPFRVHEVIPIRGEGKDKRLKVGLKLHDPKMPGLLHEIAEALLKLKAEKGGDYVVEDARTTKLLWTTASSGERR